jgi:hypothetical protein
MSAAADRGRPVGATQAPEPTMGPRGKHDRVAAERVRAVDQRRARLATQQLEAGGHVDKLGGSIEVASGRVAHDVVPHAGSDRAAATRRLELDHRGNRQQRTLAGRELGRSRQRSLSLWAAIEHHEHVLVSHDSNDTPAEPRLKGADPSEAGGRASAANPRCQARTRSPDGSNSGSRATSPCTQTPKTSTSTEVPISTSGGRYAYAIERSTV